eukprot:jgi/Botrbrau1/16211/Bobra.314_2s0005.1
MPILCFRAAYRTVDRSCVYTCMSLAVTIVTAYRVLSMAYRVSRTLDMRQITLDRVYRTLARGTPLR